MAEPREDVQTDAPTIVVFGEDIDEGQPLPELLADVQDRLLGLARKYGPALPPGERFEILDLALDELDTALEPVRPSRRCRTRSGRKTWPPVCAASARACVLSRGRIPEYGRSLRPCLARAQRTPATRRSSRNESSRAPGGRSGAGAPCASRAGARCRSSSCRSRAPPPSPRTSCPRD